MPCVVHLLRLKCSAQAEGDPATLRMRPNLFPHDRGYGGYSPAQNGAWVDFACLASRSMNIHRSVPPPKRRGWEEMPLSSWWEEGIAPLLDDSYTQRCEPE